MNILDKFLSSIRLNDDFDDDDEFFDDDDFEEEEEKPKRRFNKKFDDDFDDDDFDDDDFSRYDKKYDKKADKKSKTTGTAKTEKTEKQLSSSSKITPMRNKKQMGGLNNMEVCVIKPSSMDDTREIVDTLLERCTVVLNLEGIDVDIAQRVIDFSSGACYALDGKLQKISSYIFILTPSTVEISGDFQEILSSSFDTASMRKSF